jgi:DNA replication protein DnaC
MSDLKEIARKIGLRTVVANWESFAREAWLEPLLLAEKHDRDHRSSQTRIRTARIGQFKPISEFDWSWPEHIDREQIEDLFSLDFLADHSNVILVGTNGLGKSMIAQNLAYCALTKGVTTRFIKAGDMLNELVECDGSADRRKCLKKYCNVRLLVIDELGYLSYDNRFADLLYEVISGRYERHSTVVTTNKSFKAWNEIFPHAACAVTLVDRLLHKSESVLIKGKSFREKEALDRVTTKAKARQQKRKPEK